MITINETNGPVSVSPDILLKGTLELIGPLKVIGSGTIEGIGNKSKIEGMDESSSIELHGDSKYSITFESGYYKNASIVVG